MVNTSDSSGYQNAVPVLFFFLFFFIRFVWLSKCCACPFLSIRFVWLSKCCACPFLSKIDDKKIGRYLSGAKVRRGFGRKVQGSGYSSKLKWMPPTSLSEIKRGRVWDRSPFRSSKPTLQTTNSRHRQISYALIFQHGCDGRRVAPERFAFIDASRPL